MAGFRSFLLEQEVRIMSELIVLDWKIKPPALRDLGLVLHVQVCTWT